MKKKKITIVLVALLICTAVLPFSSCSLNEIYFTSNEEHYREAKLNKILNALQDEDIGSLKGLFTKAAMEEVGEDAIEDGIAYLFTVFEGNVVSYDLKGGGMFDSWRGGKRQKSTYIRAIVTTDADEYDVYCHDYIFDSIYPDNVGIRNLAVMRREDVSKYGTPPDWFFGVYRPGQIPEQIEYGHGIEHHYVTEYGDFTMPAGFYRNYLLSDDEKYIFYEDIYTPDDEIWNYCSIEFGSLNMNMTQTNSFRQNFENRVGSIFKGKSYSINEVVEKSTERGYPLFVYDAVRNDNGNMVSQYYIVSDEKYVLVTMPAWESDISEMQETAMSIVDSFVWVE